MSLAALTDLLTAASLALTVPLFGASLVAYWRRRSRSLFRLTGSFASLCGYALADGLMVVRVVSDPPPPR